MDRNTILRMAGCLDVFLNNVQVETDDGPRVWGEIADPWQRSDVEAIRPAVERLVITGAPEPQRQRAWWVRPRGHTKTTDVVLLITWILAFSRRKRRMVWIAVDKGQGLEGRAALMSLLEHNPLLRALLIIKQESVINKRTGSELRFLPADVEGAYGMLNTDVFVLDELTHWKRKTLWTAVASTFAKRGDSLVFCAMNAGFQDSWQHKLDMRLREDANWCYSSLSGPIASWITPDRLAEQETLLTPLEYRRLWQNQWGGADGEGLDDRWIERACVLTGPLDGPEPGYAYAAGVDLSWKHDWTSIVVVGKDVGYYERWENGRRVCGASRIEAETGLLGFTGPRRALPAIRDMERQDYEDGDPSNPWHPGWPIHKIEYKQFGGTGIYKLATTRTWQAARGEEIDLAEVGRTVLALHQQFGLRRVVFDVWQAVLLSQILRRRGLKVSAQQLTSKLWDELARLLIGVYRESQLQIYPDEILLSDLRRARIVEGPYGVKVESPRATDAGHGDVLVGKLLALYGCRQIAKCRAPVVPADGQLTGQGT